jgi:hypothetical protein
MARKKPEYQTRIVEPAPTFTPEPTIGWQKQGIVLKTMYHAYGLPGRIGDVVTVDPTKFDELVAKGFLKAI